MHGIWSSLLGFQIWALRPIAHFGPDWLFSAEELNDPQFRPLNMIEVVDFCWFTNLRRNTSLPGILISDNNRDGIYDNLFDIRPDLTRAAILPHRFYPPQMTYPGIRWTQRPRRCKKGVGIAGIVESSKLGSCPQSMYATSVILIFAASAIENISI